MSDQDFATAALHSLEGGVATVDEERVWGRVHLGLEHQRSRRPRAGVPHVAFPALRWKPALATGLTAVVLAVALLMSPVDPFSQQRTASAAVLDVVAALREEAAAGSGGNLAELRRLSAELLAIVVEHPDALSSIEVRELQAVIATLERVTVEVEPRNDDLITEPLRFVAASARGSLASNYRLVTAGDGAMILVLPPDRANNAPSSAGSGTATPEPLVWEVTPLLTAMPTAWSFSLGPAGEITVNAKADHLAISGQSISAGWEQLEPPRGTDLEIESRFRRGGELVTFRAWIEDGRLHLERTWSER